MATKSSGDDVALCVASAVGDCEDEAVEDTEGVGDADGVEPPEEEVLCEAVGAADAVPDAVLVAPGEGVDVKDGVATPLLVPDVLGVAVPPCERDCVDDWLALMA